MSRKSWGSGLLDILRELGVRIDRNAESAIEHEKEMSPKSSTADIVMRLSLAPPEVVEKAVEMAREAGSVDVLEARFTNAKQSMRESRRASLQLSAAAQAIAKK